MTLQNANRNSATQKVSFCPFAIHCWNWEHSDSSQLAKSSWGSTDRKYPQIRTGTIFNIKKKGNARSSFWS